MSFTPPAFEKSDAFSDRTPNGRLSTPAYQPAPHPIILSISTSVIPSSILSKEPLLIRCTGLLKQSTPNPITDTSTTRKPATKVNRSRFRSIFLPHLSHCVRPTNPLLLGTSSQTSLRLSNRFQIDRRHLSEDAWGKQHAYLSDLTDAHSQVIAQYCPSARPSLVAPSSSP